MLDLKRGFFKYPGDYKSSSPVSKRYKLIRDVFMFLSIISLALANIFKHSTIVDVILGVSIVTMGVSYYKYLQCNEEFIKKHGKYFLLIAIFIVTATLSTVFSVFELFWRKNINISVILIISAVVWATLAFLFNRKNLKEG